VWGLPGHTDTVTYLSLSPDGSHLLSNARDNTVRAWDVRPFVTDDRCSRVGLLAWKSTFHRFPPSLPPSLPNPPSLPPSLLYLWCSRLWCPTLTVPVVRWWRAGVRRRTAQPAVPAARRRVGT
jgi:WD40 repeat protein